MYTTLGILLFCLDSCMLCRTEFHPPDDGRGEVRNFFFFWRDSPQWARASSFTRFLDHTQRRTTVGRTTLDE